MSNLKLQELIAWLDQNFPPQLAESWDQVGLHFGHPESTVNRILVSLDVRKQVVEEALSCQADTLIVHHPPIFDPIQRFRFDQPQIQLYQSLIQNNLQVFAMHTNYDLAQGGMNDVLARHLGLEDIQALSYQADGSAGLGRIGQLARPMSREELLVWVKEKFQRPVLTLIEKTPQPHYQRLAIVGGSGADVMDQVAAAQADVFITGDVSYHDGHELYERPFLTIDASHYIEHFFISDLVAQIRQAAQEQGWPIEVLGSQVSTDPYHYYY